MLNPPLKLALVAADHKSMERNAVTSRRLIARVLAGRRGDESGFSIMEFIIAMTLLVIVFAATAQTFTAAVQVSGDVRARVVATNLATQGVERLRGLAATVTNFVLIPVTQSQYIWPPSGTLDGRVYTVTQDVTWAGVGLHGSACNAVSNNGLVLRATVSVTWPDMPPGTNVQSTTLLAPPIGAFGAGTGAAGIQVFNAEAQPESGVVVTTAGPTVETITTGADGCAFFDTLDVGAYTINMTSPSGLGVSNQEVSPTLASGPFSVTAGATVQRPAVTFDTGASFNFTYTYTPVAPTPAPATNLSVSEANPTLTLGFFPDTPTGTSPGPYSTGPLFPFPSGYNFFAGDCSDANPQGLNNVGAPFYALPPPTPIPVAAGLPSVGTVALYPLNITLQNSAGVQVSINNPVVISAQPIQPPAASGNGGTCPSTPTYGLTAPPILATPASATGVGLGHLTITASAKIGGSTKNGTATIWVRPDGVYMADPVTGAKGALVYLFSAPTFLPIRLA